jgi:aspartyl-tRNA(Asn)/glutamyl-tRNA(Gln) amidotransferase subunit B
VTAANGAAKQASNWIMGDVLGALNRTEKDITESPITPVQLGGLIARMPTTLSLAKLPSRYFRR